MFNKVLAGFLAEIVFYHIRSNNIKIASLQRLLELKGFKVSYEGLRSSLNAHNIACYNFVYWSRIYEALNINIDSGFIDLYIKAKEYNTKYLLEFHENKRKKKVN
jgi:hypothetical protein